MNTSVEARSLRAVRFRYALFAVLGALFVVDTLHSILNLMLRPFTGPLDDVMHVILVASPVIYVGVLAYIGWRWISFDRIGELLPKVITPIIFGLVCVVVFEAVYSALASPRAGSSMYRPLFPDFVTGLILGAGTLVVGRDHIRSRSGRIVVGAIACSWVIGNLLVDSLWFTEGTRRGVGPLWDVPLVSALLTGFSYVVIVAGGLVAFCVNLPLNLQAGSIVNYIWWVSLSAMLVWAFYRFSGRRAKLGSIALASSTILLAAKLVEWSSFVAD